MLHDAGVPAQQQPGRLQGVAPVEAVNERIGTAAEGQTFPATGVPFGMTQWTPQTRAGEAKCVAPYYAADRTIQGFRGSHFLSGSCAQDYGSFTLMPLLSPERLDAAGRGSAFDRATEHASPYLYRVDLAGSGIHAELTGSARCGMMLFRFPASQRTGWLALDNNLRLGHGSVHIDVERQEITGENPVYRIYAGANQPAGFAGYIVAQFDTPFAVGGTWVGTGIETGIGTGIRPGMGSGAGSGAGTTPGIERHDGATEQSADRAAGRAGISVDAASLGAFVRFELPPDRTVRVRIGTSFTSIAEARRNLAAEMPDWNFAAATGRAQQTWNTALSAIEVQGDSPDRPVFYTALYHAMLLPRICSDVSGSYPRFAGGAVEQARGFTYYCDYSIWDTFRAVHPLLTILQPERESDMVRSLIAKGEQGGFLPIFPAWNSYTSEMTGDHAGAIITDAYVKGILGFDAEAAYRLMRKNATENPADPALYKDGRGRRALDSYLRYGYIPLEDHVPNAFHADEQVSRTLDYAYDDFEVSVMAAALGHRQDAATFAERAQNWRKVIDPATGFARGRHADGSWITPFNPAVRASYITESTPYVYTFFVLHDVPGLIDTLHGPGPFVDRLDNLFAAGLYDHGNEPSHHIAYLYDEAGQPAKTQFHVHQVMTSLYRNTDDGLAGNDDAGQMSAWYVMSALGFYPVTPGTPRYSLGTPHFDEVTLYPGAGRPLHIVAPGAESGRFYVRSAWLNGRRLDRPYLLHSDILGGGELRFEMSSFPSSP